MVIRSIWSKKLKKSLFTYLVGVGICPVIIFDLLQDTFACDLSHKEDFEPRKSAMVYI